MGRTSSRGCRFGAISYGAPAVATPPWISYVLRSTFPFEVRARRQEKQAYSPTSSTLSSGMDKKETVLKNLSSKTRHFGTSNYQGKTVLDSRWCHLFLWGDLFKSDRQRTDLSLPRRFFGWRVRHSPAAELGILQGDP